jgi:hypothetical protein
MITCEDDPTHRRFADLKQGHRGLNADSNEPADESQTYNRRMQARPEVPIVDLLESMKGRFGSQAARQVEALLDEAATAQVTGSGAIGRLHEVLLFMRAYPASSGVLRKTDRLLRAFARRIEDPDAYAGGEISGIAGTRISAIFSHEVARRLAARHRRRLTLNWEGYAAPVHLPPVLLRKLSLLGEDWPVEANIPFEQWFDLRGLDWLLNELDADTYDALRIALTWSFGSAAATRSHARWPAARVYYHDAPLLRRSDVSLAEHLAGAPLPARRLDARESSRLLDFILETSAARYRELYGFTWPDRKHVWWADAGRGVEMCLFGVPPERRLPLRAYHAGMFFKNGVPAGYFETLSLFERAEVGFNLYPGFRDGETAYLYARLLRLLRQALHVTAFAVDPYQIGLHNEEAIESGAYWFYRKLGFEPVDSGILKMTQREESKMAETPGYRTPPTKLRRLAAGGLLYAGAPDWDCFSVRQLGMRVARSSGDAAPWPAVLAAIPEFSRWSPEERLAVDQIVSAKTGATEQRYLRLMQRHSKLREAMLRLGSVQEA